MLLPYPKKYDRRLNVCNEVYHFVEFLFLQNYYGNTKFKKHQKYTIFFIFKYREKIITTKLPF